MNRILIAALLTIVAMFSAPAFANASFSHEQTCTSGLANGSNRNVAGFYNDARYGAYNWSWYSRFGGFDYAYNWVERQPNGDIYCRGSWYARPNWGGYTLGVGNRCQFWGTVRDDFLIFQKFEQCFNF